MSRIYLSAAHKSSGKTTLSVGICRALHMRGMRVQPFKKGPDYIDPLWLAQASGLKHQTGESTLQGCHNLDFNTMSDGEIIDTVLRYGASADISLIEGNKGLYDGVAVDGSDCNAALAKLTRSPVILVIDSRGVTRGVAPLLLGYQSFDPDIQIAGVIFNMSAGGRHAEKLRRVTERYTDIPVLGIVRKSHALLLDERHLGLMPSNEDSAAERKINKIAAAVSDQVDLDQLVAIAGHAEPLVSQVDDSSYDKHLATREASVQPTGALNQTPVRIGICEDPAFGFYYVGDKLALKSAGAELVAINTLSDRDLPDIDGLFIGGGFPETHMEPLSANAGLRTAIHEAIESGLPTYAECGGLMYLTENLHWKEKTAPMVGIIPADAVMYDKPQGRGQVKLKETAAMPWPGESESAIIKAHEFHYSRLENDQNRLNERGRFAYQVTRGTGITGNSDGWVYKNLLASYAHMRDTSQYHWARRFVEFVREKRQNEPIEKDQGMQLSMSQTTE